MKLLSTTALTEITLINSEYDLAGKLTLNKYLLCFSCLTHCSLQHATENCCEYKRQKKKLLFWWFMHTGIFTCCLIKPLWTVESCTDWAWLTSSIASVRLCRIKIVYKHILLLEMYKRSVHDVGQLLLHEVGFEWSSIVLFLYSSKYWLLGHTNLCPWDTEYLYTILFRKAGTILILTKVRRWCCHTA